MRKLKKGKCWLHKLTTSMADSESSLYGSERKSVYTGGDGGTGYPSMPGKGQHSTSESENEKNESHEGAERHSVEDIQSQESWRIIKRLHGRVIDSKL